MGQCSKDGAIRPTGLRLHRRHLSSCEIIAQDGIESEALKTHGSGTNLAKPDAVAPTVAVEHEGMGQAACVGKRLDLKP